MTEPTKISREAAAVELMRWHFEVDPNLIRIYWVKADHEGPTDPIRLLEVSGSAPVPSGPGIPSDTVTEYSYEPASDFPYASKVIEVTKGELRMLTCGELRLPEGWTIKEDHIGEKFERSSVYTDLASDEAGRVTP